MTRESRHQVSPVACPRADPYRVRPARPEDAAEVGAIYAPLVEHTAVSFEEVPPSVDEVRARIAATLATHPYFVAEDARGVVGYAYGGPHRARAAYRWSADVSVYVADRARRRGVGRALYAALLPALAARGVHAAFAGIALPNSGSVGLHEALGFTPVGVYREVGFKFGRWHDVGWWQRLLDAVPVPRRDPPS
ncbi:N-acetyltransferase [Gemmatimonadetes bacterium T265]|nr:N-acetyltransferase [Gemmatimonadetes bacterium T265]